jgi:spermidine synthase
LRGLVTSLFVGITSVDRVVLFAAAGLGMTTIVTQTILLREFLTVFSGNELIIGVVLANWMILTGAGSVVGRVSERVQRRRQLLLVLLAAVALLPIFTVYLLAYLRSIVFLPGTMIGLVEAFYSSFVLLVPFCLSTGFVFTLISQVLSEKVRENPIAGVYGVEAAGSVVGGLAFNLGLVYLLSTFQSLLLLAAINAGICAWLARDLELRVVRYLSLGLIVLLVVLMVAWDLDRSAAGHLFPAQKIVDLQDTPYGKLTVTEQSGQLNFFENSVLLFSTGDVSQCEEAVHYAMVQHPRPRSILLLSGGIAGAIEEILKYDIRTVDYVEFNPWLLEMGRQYTSAFGDPAVRTVASDARRFVRQSGMLYDVVLINVPDPLTAQANRFYTVEFLRELKARLSDSAVVAMSLLSSVDYYGDDARRLTSVVINTMRAVFTNVLIVPGMKNYFLASDAQLDIRVGSMIKEKGIQTLYVNQDYIDDTLLRDRSDMLHRIVESGAGINEDFTPVAYYRQLRYWLSQFGLEPWMVGVSGCLLLVLGAWRFNTITFGMLTGGFAASSLEVLLLIAFQVLYGYVYHILGLIITTFMAGLAVGALAGRRFTGQRTIITYAGLQFGVMVVAALLPMLLLFLRILPVHDAAIHAVFFASTLLIGTLIGAEFATAARLLQGSVAVVASSLYGVDLVGAAVGGLLMSAFLLPLLGVGMSSLVVAAVCAVGGLVAILNRKRYVASSFA